jgi:hypothetical protein
LVKNGVPFDIAFSLSDHEAMGWGIIFGQFDGGAWDWSRMAWKPPEK